MKLSPEQFNLIEEVANGEGFEYVAFPNGKNRCLGFSGDDPHKFIFSLGRRLDSEDQAHIADKIYDCMSMMMVGYNWTVYFKNIEAEPEEIEDEESAE